MECKYYDWTRGQVNLLLNKVGEENARNLLAGTVSLKFNPSGQSEKIESLSRCADWTEGQVEALLNVIGEDNARNIVSGVGSFVIGNFEGTLFDKNGRRIPKKLEFNVCDAGEPIQLGELFFNGEGYDMAINELNRPLGGAIKIRGYQLEHETKRLLALIKENDRVSKILKGAWLPIVLPKLKFGEINETLNDYHRAVKFNYYRHRGLEIKNKGSFVGEVHVSPKSRYEKVIEKMQKNDSVAIYFPNALQGYSVLASREQMASLPEGFVLSGFEPLIAAAMYPWIFANHNTYLELSAFSWILNPAKGSLTQNILRTRDAGLVFGPNLSLRTGFPNFSSGLLFIG